MNKNNTEMEWTNPRVDKLYNLLYVTCSFGRVFEDQLFYVIKDDPRTDLKRLLELHQYTMDYPRRVI